MTDSDRPAVSRNLLLVLGSVVAAALLFAGVVLPLLGGDAGEDTVETVEVGAAQPGGSPTSSPSLPSRAELVDPDDVEDDDLGADPPPETIEIFSARDPFQQLVDAEGGGAGDGGAGDGTGGTTPTPTTPGVTPGVTPTPGATAAPGGTPTPAPSPRTPAPGDGDGNGDGNGNGNGDDPGSDVTVGGTTITLVDVFTDDGRSKAIVTLNGTGYTVREGQNFAERFRALDIAGRCATLLFGDSRFTLCEGEQIRK